MKEVPLEFSPAPVVVLVRPQLAENIGMVARAMMNCGLCELRIVNPRENPLCAKAKSASSGAGEILKRAQVFCSLDDALSDAHVVFATTARERDMNKPLMTPVKAIQKSSKAIDQAKKVAWVFGPERTGLENEDLSLSDALVQIPLNPAHSSLNLSQAVLIMGYIWWTRAKEEKLVMGDPKLATKQELNRFLSCLDRKLSERGYYAYPDKKERMQRNLHNIFERNSLTSSEIKTLYNVIKAFSQEFRTEKIKKN